MSHLDVKFADMPSGTRQRWLDWANSHDWGGRQPARFTYDRVRGLVLQTECAGWDRHGNMTVETAFHKTPRQLRDWAGY